MNIYNINRVNIEPCAFQVWFYSKSRTNDLCLKKMQEVVRMFRKKLSMNLHYHRMNRINPALSPINEVIVDDDEDEEEDEGFLSPLISGREESYRDDSAQDAGKSDKVTSGDDIF
jgi:hypothetical protein